MTGSNDIAVEENRGWRSAQVHRGIVGARDGAVDSDGTALSRGQNADRVAERNRINDHGTRLNGVADGDGGRSIGEVGKDGSSVLNLPCSSSNTNRSSRR